MNSSQFSMSRSEVEFFTPRPITYLLFSLSLETSGEKSESPEATTKQLMCSFWNDMSMASTTRRMSAEFLPPIGLLGHLDQLDGRLVEAALVVRVPAPVGVGLLDQELALVEQPLQDEVDVELAVVGVADADGDVLEIDEEGEPLLVLVLMVRCQKQPPKGFFDTPDPDPGVPGGGAREETRGRGVSPTIRTRLALTKTKRAAAPERRRPAR